MTPFLTTDQLSKRWCITPTTLKQWRWNGRGPHYLKLGGRILYRLEDIQQFEAQKLRQNTSQEDCPESRAFNP